MLSDPKLWSSLPPPLRDLTWTLTHFGSWLKSENSRVLFSHVPCDCLCCKGCVL